MATASRTCATLSALVLGSRLDSTDFLILAGLITVWMTPDWLAKLLVLYDELQRFREESDWSDRHRGKAP
jgi:hypothetical protein